MKETSRIHKVPVRTELFRLDGLTLYRLDNGEFMVQEKLDTWYIKNPAYLVERNIFGKEFHEKCRELRRWHKLGYEDQYEELPPVDDSPVDMEPCYVMDKDSYVHDEPRKEFDELAARLPMDAYEEMTMLSRDVNEGVWIVITRTTMEFFTDIRAITGSVRYSKKFHRHVRRAWLLDELNVW